MQPLPLLPVTRFGEGGESLVYEHPTNRDLLIKLFTDSGKNRAPRTGAEAAHIESLNDFQNGISYSHRQLLSTNFSWPIETYGNRPGVIDAIGILRAPEDFWIDITMHSGKVNHLFLQVGYLTTDYLTRPAIKSAPFTDVRFVDRVEVALEFLYSFQVLWDLGYRYCDFKEQNFSFTLNGRPRVFIIDAESISPPNMSEWRTEDWYPPDKNDFTMESDRSLACLLVWRIIGKSRTTPPSQGNHVANFDDLDKRTLDLLEDGYRHGSQEIIDELIRELTKYRSAENIRKAFEWAADTQLATLVLRYAPPNPSQQEALFLADAMKQKALEDDLMALNPRLRKVRLNSTVPFAGFRMDIPDWISVGGSELDAESIRLLALDGEFEEVAQAFIGRTTSAPVGRLVTRAIQAAIAQIGPPLVRTRVSPAGEFQLQWSWPGADIVNGARILLYLPDGTLSQEGYCDRAKQNPSITFPAGADIPDGSKLWVSYAMLLDDATIVCPLPTKTAINGLQKKVTHTSAAAPSTARTSGSGRDASLEHLFRDIAPVPIVGKDSAISIDVSKTGGGREVEDEPGNESVPDGKIRNALRVFGKRLFGRRR
jgi:hypothetical protein